MTSPADQPARQDSATRHGTQRGSLGDAVRKHVPNETDPSSDAADVHGCPPAPQVLLLRVEDVCLQLSLSRAAVYRLIAAGRLPSVTLGRTRRVVQADLDRFVDDLATGRTDGRGRGNAR